MPEIRAENLTYDYPGCRALDNVSFTLPTRSVTALVGPNGSGKTTLMRCMAGLDQSLSGSIYIDGIPVADNPRSVYARTGYLHDAFGVYNSLTISQCLRHAASMRGAGTAKQEAAWVDAVVSRLGLQERLQQKAGNLSRGWKQRLGIAQAIIHNPEILILDEPASGLDPDARAYLSALVRQLNAEGMTIVISSHILTELQAYSTHMLTLANGRCLGLAPLSASQEDRQIIRLLLAHGHAGFEKALRAMDGIRIVNCSDAGAEIEYLADAAAHAGLLKGLVESGFAISHFAAANRDMQEIYHQAIRRDAEGQVS